MIAAILGPFDRAAAVARCEGNEKIFRIELPARSEASADIQLDHVHGGLRQRHQLRQNPPAGERRLGGAMHHHAIPVPGGEQRP